MELSLLILVCIHKSYIVYLEIYVVPIGHGFSFFFVMDKSWKINVEKEGAPCYKTAIYSLHMLCFYFLLRTNYGMRHRSYCRRRTRNAAVTVTVTVTYYWRWVESDGISTSLSLSYCKFWDLHSYTS